MGTQKKPGMLSWVFLKSFDRIAKRFDGLKAFKYFELNMSSINSLSSISLYFISLYHLNRLENDVIRSNRKHMSDNGASIFRPECVNQN